MTGEVISQKRLSGATKYDYCFHCMKAEESKPSSEPRQKLLPLFYVTTLELVDCVDEKGNVFKKRVFDNFYRCTRCGKELSVDDFRNEYTCRADRTKWTESPKGW